MNPINFDQHDFYEFKKTLRQYCTGVVVVSLALLLAVSIPSCEVKPAMSHTIQTS